MLEENDDCGRSPLVYNIYQKKAPITAITLLKHGADVNVVFNTNGQDNDDDNDDDVNDDGDDDADDNDDDDNDDNDDGNDDGNDDDHDDGNDDDHDDDGHENDDDNDGGDDEDDEDDDNTTTIITALFRHPTHGSYQVVNYLIEHHSDAIYNQLKNSLPYILFNCVPEAVMVDYGDYPNPEATRKLLSMGFSSYEDYVNNGYLSIDTKPLITHLFSTFGDAAIHEELSKCHYAPIAWAAQRGCLSAIEAFCQHGFNILTRFDGNNTILHHARTHIVVDWLFTHHNPNGEMTQLLHHSNSYGLSPLAHRVPLGWFPPAKALLRHGAQLPPALYHEGYDLLFFEVLILYPNNECADFIKYVMMTYPHFINRPIDLHTLRSSICLYGDLTLLQLYLQQFPAMNQDPMMIHQAALSTKPDILQYLLTNDINVEYITTVENDDDCPEFFHCHFTPLLSLFRQGIDRYRSIKMFSPLKRQGIDGFDDTNSKWGDVIELLIEKYITHHLLINEHVTHGDIENDKGNIKNTIITPKNDDNDAYNTNPNPKKGNTLVLDSDD